MNNKKKDSEKKIARPKQSDVAKAAGVVPSTVSKVINGNSKISQEVKDRVINAIRDLGYVAPSAKQKIKDFTPASIKLVTYHQFITSDTRYFHSEVIQSVLEECRKNKIEISTVLLDIEAPNDIDNYRTQLSDSATDGVLFIGIDAPEYLIPVRDLGIPGVVINGSDPDYFFDSISPAYRDGCKLVTRHLLSLGHRDIIHVTHLYRSFIHNRLDGFRDALEEAGIEFSMDRHVLNIGDMEEKRFSPEKAADEMYRRINDGSLKATAFFCVTDYTAFGVIQGIQRSGKSVPGDYSVASFDDLPLSQMVTPKITSAGVDRSVLGRMAVQRLLDHIKTPQSPVLRIEVGAHFSARESTRKLGE
jgi:DNA-binding LacI/PurR family transcriptional regulator